MRHVQWATAVERIYRQGRELAVEQELSLEQAFGAVLAEDVFTPVPLPHYDSSAMDGYACAGRPPWRLIELGEAGPRENLHRRAPALTDGYAAPILTGGLLPAGAEAVLRLEQAELTEREGKVFLSPTGPVPAPGTDIRRTGEEIPAGTRVAESGTLLSARLVAFLSVCGIDTVRVYRRLSVSIAYTGNEVVSRGIPGPGEVRDAYSVQFPDLIRRFGADPVFTAHLHDNLDEFRAWFEGAEQQNSRVLLLTGGSSTSEVDLLRRVLAGYRARYLFEAVAVRPGHPCLAALLPDSRLVLGLPGNPLAAHTSLYSYVPALVAGSRARPLPVNPTAVVSQALPAFGKPDERLVPAFVGEGKAQPLTDRSRSHMLSSFARANALLLVPPRGAQVGESLGYLPLDT